MIAVTLVDSVCVPPSPIPPAFFYWNNQINIARRASVSLCDSLVRNYRTLNAFVNPQAFSDHWLLFSERKLCKRYLVPEILFGSRKGSIVALLHKCFIINPSISKFLTKMKCSIFFKNVLFGPNPWLKPKCTWSRI